MLSSSNKLVNMSSFSWYPWKKKEKGQCTVWLIVVMSLLLQVTNVSAQSIKQGSDALALTQLEIQKMRVPCGNGFRDSQMQKKQLFLDEYILPVECTVFNPSIILQNHETVTINFTSFILRNILSFNFPTVSTEHFPLINGSLQIHKHSPVAAIETNCDWTYRY